MEDVIHNRRPCRFKASPEEMAALRAAAELAALRPGASRPDHQFLENVHAYISLTLGRILP
ncbi:MAG TPA: hypothetical protein VF213_02245 [Dongiaceae bacterium]